jgi:hypothetical protein
MRAAASPVETTPYANSLERNIPDMMAKVAGPDRRVVNSQMVVSAELHSSEIEQIPLDDFRVCARVKEKQTDQEM